MRARLLVVTVAAFAAATSAAAAQAPQWNSGYGWWPAGFGYPPLTFHAHNFPCSLTVNGPTFNFNSFGWNQAYGGGTSCAGGVGRKTLTVSAQVLGQDGHTWFTIRGSTVTSGPTNGNPLRIKRVRAASLGHSYRAVASAKPVVPNGHAGCSLNNTCSQTLHLGTVSLPLAP